MHASAAEPEILARPRPQAGPIAYPDRDPRVFPARRMMRWAAFRLAVVALAAAVVGTGATPGGWAVPMLELTAIGAGLSACVGLGLVMLRCRVVALEGSPQVYRGAPRLLPRATAHAPLATAVALGSIAADAPPDETWFWAAQLWALAFAATWWAARLAAVAFLVGRRERRRGVVLYAPYGRAEQAAAGAGFYEVPA